LNDHPYSLVVFKIISKAYASKLDPIANMIVSPNQTMFIKGRNILEGPLALMEIIHDIRKRKHSGVLLKLDFEKAYDRVNWDFLGEVLCCKGFDEGYIHRILQLVSGGKLPSLSMERWGRFFGTGEGFDRETPSLHFSSTSSAKHYLGSYQRSSGRTHPWVSPTPSARENYSPSVRG
jgi:hypothetical protein